MCTYKISVLSTFGRHWLHDVAGAWVRNEVFQHFVNTISRNPQHQTLSKYKGRFNITIYRFYQFPDNTGSTETRGSGFVPKFHHCFVNTITQTPLLTFVSNYKANQIIAISRLYHLLVDIEWKRNQRQGFEPSLVFTRFIKNRSTNYIQISQTNL